MALINPFMLGACTIGVLNYADVLQPSPTYIWSGSLGLNQSSPIFYDPGFPTHQLQVTVDANGNVSLISPDGLGGGTGPYSLRCYAPNGPYGEVGSTLITWAYGNQPYATCNLHNNVTFSNTSGNWLPNPATYVFAGLTFAGVG